MGKMIKMMQIIKTLLSKYTTMSWIVIGSALISFVVWRDQQAYSRGYTKAALECEYARKEYINKRLATEKHRLEDVVAHMKQDQHGIDVLKQKLQKTEKDTYATVKKVSEGIGCDNFGSQFKLMWNDQVKRFD
jgi:hypothetical protein